MWHLDTLWVEVVVVIVIFAVGNILFGHFEEHHPIWRRLLKPILILAVILGISITIGRVWAFSLLGGLLGFPLYIHAYWLPRNGVNGWTGEPRERYYNLIGHKE